MSAIIAEPIDSTEPFPKQAKILAPKSELKLVAIAAQMEPKKRMAMVRRIIGRLPTQRASGIHYEEALLAVATIGRMGILQWG